MKTYGSYGSAETLYSWPGTKSGTPSKFENLDSSRRHEMKMRCEFVV